ncbi:hypothetical protein E2320_001259 [Naja naja]|nr:hypothetical protein E2320_001259 [Naja naja]
MGSNLHFCTRFLTTTLCLVFLLCPSWNYAKRRWRRQLKTSPLKLVENYDDYEDSLHPHSAHYQKNDRCPPPSQTLPDRACEVPSCRSDSECEKHKRCCYNGCIYACLESVPPPPAETCSTTEDGDDPLHCPTGFECHIIHPGNAAEGIPNQGQCIKLRGNFGRSSSNVVGYVKQTQKHLG